MGVNVDVVVGLAMVVGLVGTLVPLLPGLPIIIMAAFIWVVADGADLGQWTVFAGVSTIAVTGMVVGSLLPARRASASGASRWALAAGALGVVVGALVIPFVGALIGWPVGVFLAEWLRMRDGKHAWASMRATAAGVSSVCGGTRRGQHLGCGCIAVVNAAVVRNRGSRSAEFFGGPRAVNRARDPAPSRHLDLTSVMPERELRNRAVGEKSGTRILRCPHLYSYAAR